MAGIITTISIKSVKAFTPTLSDLYTKASYVLEDTQLIIKYNKLIAEGTLSAIKFSKKAKNNTDDASYWAYYGYINARASCYYSVPDGYEFYCWDAGLASLGNPKSSKAELERSSQELFNEILVQKKRWLGKIINNF